MKKLDLFSRFEYSVSLVWAIGVIVFPAMIVVVIDKLFLESFGWFIRYPGWIVVYFISLAISIAIGGILHNTFNEIRKILRKKSVWRIIKEQREEQQLQEEQEIKEQFMSQSEAENLYWLWARQNQQFEDVASEIRSLKLFVISLFITILVLALLIGKLRL